ncbi:MAG TPA: hypothetical protein EYH44_05205 [Thermoprotei archaeon]|nr:hypothetical protein [Thermoprotei archaeon]
MSMNTTVLNVRVLGYGEAKLAIDNDKGFFIVSEFRKKNTIYGIAMLYKNVVNISINIKKGIRGIPGVFKRGSVLYSPIYDSLAIVLNDFESREHNYIEVGYVEEGIETFEKIRGVVKLRISLP